MEHNNASQVMLAPEAESIIEQMLAVDVKEVGGPRWAQHHEHVERLNMQAVLHASQQEDEFVKEFLITYEKIPVLIMDLLSTEVWKQKVFPEFIRQNLEPTVMFPIYMVIYHEVTVLNLLETVLYHNDACQAADDRMLDLLDYTYRKLSAFISQCSDRKAVEEVDKEQVKPSSLQELQTQQQLIEFNLALKSISILCYISDHITSLPMSVLSRLLNTHDVPLLLVQLLESRPWTRNKKGQLQKYIDGKWCDVADTDRFTLTKTEGQIWLALFQLLMREECQRKYELNSFRKNSILKLRSHLTEVLIDQIPALGDFHRYLENLSMMEPPAIKKDLLLEQFPEIREGLLKANKGKWKAIATKQSKTFFDPKKVDMRAQAQRLSETYAFDVLENMLADPPKCVQCGEGATKRCSRCQNEWYCRRECQVKHWKKHQSACNLLVDSLKKLKMTSKD